MKLTSYLADFIIDFSSLWCGRRECRAEFLCFERTNKGLLRLVSFIRINFLVQPIVKLYLFSIAPLGVPATI